MCSFSDVEKLSGTAIQMYSSQPGLTTFAIHGTRGQILEALRMITTKTGKKVDYLSISFITFDVKKIPLFTRSQY